MNAKNYTLHLGDNLATLKTYKDNLIKRFYTKYAVDPVTGCYNWIGTKDKEGYGVFYDNRIKNNRRAHRIAMEIAGTPIPDNLQTLHQCDNKSCVNPNHLRAGTNYDNQIEARDRGLLGDLTNKRKEYIRSLSEDEYQIWEQRFIGLSGKALANRTTARNWRAA